MIYVLTPLSNYRHSCTGRLHDDCALLFPMTYIREQWHCSLANRTEQKSVVVEPELCSLCLKYLRLSFHNIRMVLLALNFLGFTSAPSLTSDSVKFYHHCVGRFSFLRSSFINSIAHQRYSTLFNTSRVEVAFMIPIRGWFLPRNIFSSCYNRTQNSVGSSVGPIQKLGKLLPKVDLTAITRRFRTKTQI